MIVPVSEPLGKALGRSDAFGALLSTGYDFVQPVPVSLAIAAATHLAVLAQLLADF